MRDAFGAALVPEGDAADAIVRSFRHVTIISRALFLLSRPGRGFERPVMEIYTICRREIEGMNEAAEPRPVAGKTRRVGSGRFS